MSWYKNDDIATRSSRSFRWISSTYDSIIMTNIKYAVIGEEITESKIIYHGYVETSILFTPNQIREAINSKTAQVYNRMSSRNEARNYCLQLGGNITEYGTWREKVQGRVSISTKVSTQFPFAGNIDTNATRLLKSEKSYHIFANKFGQKRDWKTITYYYWGDMIMAQNRCYEESKYTTQSNDVAIIFFTEDEQFLGYNGQTKAIIKYDNNISYSKLVDIMGDKPLMVQSKELHMPIQWLVKELWVYSEQSPNQFAPKSDYGERALSHIDKNVCFIDGKETIIPYKRRSKNDMLTCRFFVEVEKKKYEPCNNPCPPGCDMCILCQFVMKTNPSKIIYRKCSTPKCGNTVHPSDIKHGKDICPQCQIKQFE